MNTDRIDFISSYCDRWCERCAFTSRCSAFAAAAAIAMCGDAREGLELAIGEPHPVEPGGTPAAARDWLVEIENLGMTSDEDERAEFDRQEKERDARIAGTSIMKIARACGMLAGRWLSDRYQSVIGGADDVLREALAVAFHDAYFVTAKLSRALGGRDRHQHERGDDNHPVQNDWNGSAKVALISLERSESAWRVIAQATGDDAPAMLAEQLYAMRGEVEEVFPDARSFVRPGFDEPGR